MKRTYLAVPLAMLLLLIGVGCTPRDESGVSCLGSDRSTVTVTGSHTNPWPGGLYPLPDNTGIDARGQVFNSSNLDEEGFGTGVKFHYKDTSRDHLCFTGGRITNNMGANKTAWSVWHRVVGMTVLTPNFSVIGTSFYNQGDAIAFGSTATNWKIIGVRADGANQSSGAYIHDDCIENDGMNNGLVDDAKFDGCAVFLSANDNGMDNPINGGSHTVEVRDTLVRLQPYENSYDTKKYGFNTHGGFFKWSVNTSTDGTSPKLYVHDSTFRSDTPGRWGGNANGFLGLPSGARCNNVTLVGTEAWPAKDLQSWKSQCTNLKLASVTTWNSLVASWNAAHPSW